MLKRGSVVIALCSVAGLHQYMNSSRDVMRIMMESVEGSVAIRANQSSSTQGNTNMTAVPNEGRSINIYNEDTGATDGASTTVTVTGAPTSAPSRPTVSMKMPAKDAVVATDVTVIPVAVPEEDGQPIPEHAPAKAPLQIVAKNNNPKEQQAIDAYLRKAESSATQSLQCASSRNGNGNDHRKVVVAADDDDDSSSRALACLRQTTPNLSLEYPDDAVAHFNEIRRAMAPWAQHAAHKMHRAARYAGPWIENEWISHFETIYDTKYNSTCLSDHFGPFIPLFLPWVDHWVRGGHRYPEGLIETLRSVLRPNVPYVTVSQNDEGITGKNELDLRSMPNILVLSAGGYGHVPIPLLKQPEMVNNDKDASVRTIGVSYVGSLKHAPNAMRKKVHAHLLAIAPKNNASAFTYEYAYGDNWRQIMADSRFSLVPRGFGRTAYHLMETLQMGLVPIYVYSDTPWVPYLDLFAELGFVTTLEGIDQLVIGKLQNMTADEIRERERRIVALRTSHFSVEGTLAQIRSFLKGGASDLQCQGLPSTVRGG